jgi:hypothetical protein
MKIIEKHDDSAVKMHVGCGDYFTPCLVNVASSVHNTRPKNRVHPQFYVEAVGRTGCKDCCLLAVALVYFLHVMGRNAPHAVYAKL